MSDNPDGAAAEALLEGKVTTVWLANYFDVPLGTIQKAARRGVIGGCHKILGRYYFDKEEAIASYTPGEVQLRENPDQKIARRKDGPFAKGNTAGVGTRGGPGRHTRAVETKYLKALSDSVPLEEWVEIVKRAIVDAKDGNWRARQWLSNYLIGRPTEKVKVETEITTKHSLEDAERAARVEALLSVVRARGDDGGTTEPDPDRTIPAGPPAE